MSSTSTPFRTSVRSLAGMLFRHRELSDHFARAPASSPVDSADRARFGDAATNHGGPTDAATGDSSEPRGCRRAGEKGIESSCDRGVDTGHPGELDLLGAVSWSCLRFAVGVLGAILGFIAIVYAVIQRDKLTTSFVGTGLSIASVVLPIAIAAQVLTAVGDSLKAAYVAVEADKDPTESG